MILHQLRWIMGDSAFFAALNNYLYDPLITYSFSRTQQLKDHLESASGMDLSGYFDDWYTGEGYPSYQVNWGQEGGTVSLILNQTQSHPSVSFFEMPVSVQFKNAERDTILRFSNTFSGQSFSVFIPFPVDSVIIDPEYQLISGNNKTNAVEELMPKSRIEVFPNPADDHVTFSLMGKTAREPDRIGIFDFSGRLVEEAAIGQGKSTVTLSVGHLSPGLYIYHYLQTCGKFVIRR
jgi:hypothetical protein